MNSDLESGSVTLPESVLANIENIEVNFGSFCDNGESGILTKFTFLKNGVFGFLSINCVDS